MEFKYMSILWLTKPTLKETKTHAQQGMPRDVPGTYRCEQIILSIYVWTNRQYHIHWWGTIPDNRKKKTIHLTKEWIPKTHRGEEGLNKMFVLFNCLYSLREQVNKMLMEKIQTSECLEKVQGWGGRRHRRGLPWTAANVILHSIWH